MSRGQHSKLQLLCFTTDLFLKNDNFMYTIIKSEIYQKHLFLKVTKRTIIKMAQHKKQILKRIAMNQGYRPYITDKMIEKKG